MHSSKAHREGEDQNQPIPWKKIARANRKEKTEQKKPIWLPRRFRICGNLKKRELPGGQEKRAIDILIPNNE
jgi:hypothetical protein